MLDKLMQEIAQEYEFPFRTSDDKRTHLMECKFEGGRTQVVSGTTLEERGQRAHVIFTIVGKYAPEIDLQGLIRRHMFWRNAKVGILGDDLVVCCCLDPARVEGPEGRGLVEQALQEVSIHGDRLEDELFGKDVN